MTITPDEASEKPVMVRLAEPGEDLELKSIAYILSVLHSLDIPKRLRVMKYLNSRFS